MITVVREQKFSGKCDSLSGFVYDCSDGKQSDRFNIVTKEIAEYVGREYPYGSDIRWTIQNLKLFKEEDPNELAAASSVLKKRMWEKRVDEYIKRENKLKENCQMAYSLVIGQCMAYMRTKIEAVVEYRDMESRSDLIGLIKTIKGLSFQLEGQQSKTRGLVLAHKRFQYLNQTRDINDACFLEKFLTCVAVLEQYGGTIGRDQGAVEDEIDAAGYTILANAEETKQVSDVARSKFLAMAYLLAVDKHRYGKLLDELENDFAKGTDNYPDSVTRAYNLVVNHKGQQRVVSRLFNDSEAVSFANVDGKKVPPDIATIKCYA
jgi:TolA-binding protein